MEEKWYAVYTKSRCERKVAEALTKMNLENYCPLTKVLRQWSDRKKLVQEPLFKSYVFVRINEKQFIDLKKIEGVVNLVYWLGKPATIKDSDILLIKQFLCDHQNVRLEQLQQKVKINDPVVISKGSFINKKGTIVAVKNNIVKIELPSLGQVICAECPKSSIMTLAGKL